MRIPKFVKEVQEKAENINQGYVTFEDLKQQLYEDHKIILEMRRGANDDR